jgi:hypothetical protein
MHKQMRGLVALGMLLLLSTACAARTAETTNGEQRAPAEVTVINRAAEHMTIYVFRGAERVRLGTVSPGMEETYRIPDRLIVGVTRLRFVAEPPGARPPAAIVDHNVAPGGHVEVIIR